MSGKDILITAGPTHEPIDPVRFITNKSSGKMGYSLVEAAVESGARVTLISGPVNLETPPNCHKVSVETAKEMHEAVMHHIKGKDVYIGTAAVADYSPAEIKNSKIKKDVKRSPLNLELKENQDILRSVSELEERPYIVGFAAETDGLIENAEKKLENKGLDLIVANDVSNEEIGFDSDENEVTLITKTEQQLIPKQNKKQISKKIVEFISRRINEQNN